MKDIFKYTFLTVAEIKKFLLVIILVSILSIIQAYPVISIVSFIFEKLIYLSIGVLLIYLIRITDNDKEYFATLEKQPFSTFLLHFIPSAMGIMLGGFIIVTLFATFFIIILKFTGSIFILANPHDFLLAVSKTSFITKVLLGFFSVYLLFYSYVFLGKLGEALSKETFKESFLSIISSIIDFKFWIKTFNLKYVVIYFVWSVLTSIIYTIIAFAYLFYIFPLILNHPNMTIIIIPLLVAITTIMTYFTFFSAYFAYKTTRD
ncbi:putative membrane protein [Nautilia profundicola AmH]|uniref:Membrane protein n=1 Tax=Nautilia profundicola (strain ATCC BAA-1463 / DSM 18972 / AmH) TaxID=598659 RepID=B9L8X7_NAUPA|nr:hypothetical protein [Nautilia profundicola]ACM92982.1 putative membrane protein [Nautilia profundicola AmH]